MLDDPPCDEATMLRGDDRWYWKRGQATTEATVVAVMLTAMVAMLALLLYIFKEYGVRIIDLVSSEYP
jgi:hypothetical protein